MKNKAEEAYKQASVYASSSLAGFELAGYRYLVLVSNGRLNNLPPDRKAENVIYQHINIAVEPEVPSKIK